jgi:hypothetical protein
LSATAVMPQKHSRMQTVPGISQHQIQVANESAYEAERKFTSFRENSSKPMKFIISNKFPLYRKYSESLTSLTVKAHYTDAFKYFFFLICY